MAGSEDAINSKTPRLPLPSRLAHAFSVVRDLLGAAALGSTLAILVFVTWLVLQFGHAPSVQQLADSGQTLMWIIAGVYAALWVVRALNSASAEGRADAGRRFNLAPLVRASGNAVVIVVSSCGLASVVEGLADPSWLIVAGYPIATLGALLAAAFSSRPIR
jgi:hypothetical protein